MVGIPVNGDPVEMTSPLQPIAFSDIGGWREDDLSAALAAFRRSFPGHDAAPPKTAGLGVDGTALARICARAHLLAPAPEISTARRFFEEHFRPFRLCPDSERASRPRASRSCSGPDARPDGSCAPIGAGFMTGYFEPELSGSRQRSETFRIPLHARPPDLVRLDCRNRPKNLDPDLSHARQTAAGLVEHPDREQIEKGAIDGRVPVLAFIRDQIDAYFVHIQGSARIRLPDNSLLRISYAARSGHPYTSIGRLLADREGLAPRAMTADRLRRWLRENREEGRALMWKNRSYIFFRETPGLDPQLGPVGAAGVQLTPGRSLAVDRRLHTFATPLFVTTQLPAGGARTAPFRRLMIAQDTGSAMVGACRGDIFVGCGTAAGDIAGRIRHPAQVVMLVPREEFSFPREAAP